MTTTRTKLAFAAVATLALVGMALTMTVSADVHDRFGEQVVFGDADYIPTLEEDELEDPEVCVVTFGETNPNDFGFYLKAPHNTGVGSVERDDIRLVAIEGHDIGSLVRDAHTTEIGQDCDNTLADTTVVYGDVNNNNRYDGGDYVWLTSNGGAGFVSSSGPNSWTLRLTDTSGGSAGSIVFSGDTDHLDYSGNAPELARTKTAFVNVDSAQTSGGDPRFTANDHLYIAIPYQDIAGSAEVEELTPLNSIRIHGPGGAFGSQVSQGDGDFLPLLNEIGDLTTDTEPICVADLEGDDNIGDYGVYLLLNTVFSTAPNVVKTNMIRLVSTSGGEPGSLVRSSDFAEVGLTCETPTEVNIVYADVNNNGRYDAGDYVFISTDGDLEATTSTTSWSLRLTDTDSGDAGTFMFTGDSDLTSWRGDVDPLVDANEAFGILDIDRSGTTDADRVLTRGDSVYLMHGDTAGDGASLVPVYSIRLHEGEFGTQVALGDDDFRPTLEEFTDASVCVTLLGDDIQDYGFYLQDASADVERHAIRLVEVEGNPAGSTVRTGDTTEVGQTCAPTENIGGVGDVVSVHYTDLNNNGRYDAGDHVYLVYDSTEPAEDRDGLVSSNSATQWTIRLSGDNAGTLVFSGDSDLVTYRNNAPLMAEAEAQFFNQDLHTDGFTRGDTMYISANTTTFATQLGLVNIHSVRVTGELPVTSPPPTTTPTPTPTPTDDDDVTPPPTDDDDITPPPTDDDDVTPPPVDDDDDEAEEEPTPAPAVFVVLAAIGAALVALRRRK